MESEVEVRSVLGFLRKGGMWWGERLVLGLRSVRMCWGGQASVGWLVIVFDVSGGVFRHKVDVLVVGGTIVELGVVF